jgi:hypothetical protein
MPIIINSENVQAITQSGKNWKIEQNIIFINLSITLYMYSFDVVQCEVAIIMVDNGNLWMEKFLSRKKTVV